MLKKIETRSSKLEARARPSSIKSLFNFSSMPNQRHQNRFVWGVSSLEMLSHLRKVLGLERVKFRAETLKSLFKIWALYGLYSP